MTETKATGPLVVLESAFKIIPGKETDFLAYQAKVVQLAMKQDGFRATYGSPILDSTWVYFGARFDSEEQMNAWHGEPRHRVIQKSAPNWWTALYLRKWRAPMPGEVLGDRLMSETSILVDTALDDTQIESVRQALAELGDAGAQPFETLTGEFEAQPFQFTGPVQIVPAADKVLYLLVAHWSSADHFNAWKSSGSYRALQGLGDVSSELFVPIVETRPREHLRDDKLQRDWEWTIKDRGQELSVMTTSNPREIPFNGVRLRFDSKKSFDELVSALLADVGEKPLMIDDLPAKFDSWESYKAEVESHVGPSGFILFAVMNHGAWIKKVNIRKKVLRVVIGNPLLAITMLRHDLTAGLFAPVELIVIEEDQDQSSLTYVRPSSLMVVETNEPLFAAAKELDAKLQALAAKVTMA